MWSCIHSQLVVEGLWEGEKKTHTVQLLLKLFFFFYCKIS